MSGAFGAGQVEAFQAVGGREDLVTAKPQLRPTSEVISGSSSAMRILAVLTAVSISSPCTALNHRVVMRQRCTCSAFLRAALAAKAAGDRIAGFCIGGQGGTSASRRGLDPVEVRVVLGGQDGVHLALAHLIVFSSTTSSSRTVVGHATVVPSPCRRGTPSTTGCGWGRWSSFPWLHSPRRGRPSGTGRFQLAEFANHGPGIAFVMAVHRIHDRAGPPLVAVADGATVRLDILRVGKSAPSVIQPRGRACCPPRHPTNRPKRAHPHVSRKDHLEDAGAGFLDAGGLGTDEPAVVVLGVEDPGEAEAVGMGQADARLACSLAILRDGVSTPAGSR